MQVEQDSCMWNTRVGAVFSRKDRQLDKAPGQVREALGIPGHFVSASPSGMKQGSPWGISLPVSTVSSCTTAAIYVQPLGKPRSKSCASPWEQKWWVSGGDNLPAWASFESTVSGSCPLAWKGPCAGSQTPAEHIAFGGAPLAEVKAISTCSSPGTTDPLCRANTPFPALVFLDV